MCRDAVTAIMICMFLVASQTHVVYSSGTPGSESQPSGSVVPPSKVIITLGNATYEYLGCSLAKRVGEGYPYIVENDTVVNALPPDSGAVFSFSWVDSENQKTRTGVLSGFNQTMFVELALDVDFVEQRVVNVRKITSEELNSSLTTIFAAVLRESAAHSIELTGWNWTTCIIARIGIPFVCSRNLTNGIIPLSPGASHRFWTAPDFNTDMVEELHWEIEVHCVVGDNPDGEPNVMMFTLDGKLFSMYRPVTTASTSSTTNTETAALWYLIPLAGVLVGVTFLCSVFRQRRVIT